MQNTDNPTLENPLRLKDSPATGLTVQLKTYYSTSKRKSSQRPLERPENSVHKRCPACRCHLWVVRNEKEMSCWKCKVKLKIVQALRDSTYHRHGVILQVVQ